MYIMSNPGDVRSHPAPDYQKVGFPFKGGDLVKVEVDPSAGTVTYSLVGGQERHVQPFGKQYLQSGQLHFCAYLRGISYWGKSGSVSVMDA